MDGGSIAWVYYGGYVLPLSLVGKLFGWVAAYSFSYVWSVAGLLLVVVWFMRLVGSASPLYAVLFFFFGGLDIVGHFFTAAFPSQPGGSWWDYFTGTYWWSIGTGWLDHWLATFSISEGSSFMHQVFYKFYSPMTFLCDGPHHIIPGGIAVLMIFHDALRRKSSQRLCLLWVSLPFASPLVAPGTVPFVILGAIQTRFKRAFGFGHLVATPLIALIMAAYYLSGRGDVPIGWLWDMQDFSKAWPYLLLYYVVEFGLYALVLSAMRGTKNLPPRPWWYLTLAIFFLAPLVCFGAYGDFPTKVIIPAQFVFLLYIALAIRNAATPRERKLRNVLIALLCIGSLAADGAVLRAVQYGFSFSPPPVARVRHVNEVLPYGNRKGGGMPDAFFWRHLARPLHMVAIPPIPVVQAWDFAKDSPAAKAWQLVPMARRSPEGVVITANSTTPVMRMRGLDLDTGTVGTVMADVTADCGGESTDDVKLILLWSEEEEKEGTNVWPFKRWRSAVVWPVDRSVSSNAYWRGTVREMAIILLLDKPHAQPCTVTIHKIEMLQR
jgi:hypothetical protein